MDGVVTGVESFGLFVEGLELPAQGLIHADALTDDYYVYDRGTHTLTGRRSGRTYRLGDLLRVAVARVDLERRELDFRLVERKKAKAAAPVLSPPGKHKAARGGAGEARREGEGRQGTPTHAAKTPLDALPAFDRSFTPIHAVCHWLPVFGR